MDEINVSNAERLEAIVDFMMDKLTAFEEVDGVLVMVAHTNNTTGMIGKHLSDKELLIFMFHIYNKLGALSKRIAQEMIDLMEE